MDGHTTVRERAMYATYGYNSGDGTRIWTYVQMKIITIYWINQSESIMFIMFLCASKAGYFESGNSFLVNDENDDKL